MSNAQIDAIRKVSWQIGMLLKEHEVHMTSPYRPCA
jgi:hypothetical protein